MAEEGIPEYKIGKLYVQSSAEYVLLAVSQGSKVLDLPRRLIQVLHDP